MASRAEYTFQVPASLAAKIDMREFTLVELVASEEMMAARRSAGDQVRLAFELPKESLRKVDGRPVSAADGSIDAVWEKMHPKARNLVMQAYNAIHNPAPNEVKDFLESMAVALG